VTALAHELARLIGPFHQSLRGIPPLWARGPATPQTPAGASSAPGRLPRAYKEGPESSQRRARTQGSRPSPSYLTKMALHLGGRRARDRGEGALRRKR
jgi:hypothetical protein